MMCAMRLFWIVCCVLLSAAVAWQWLDLSSADGRAHAQAAPSARSDIRIPPRIDAAASHQSDAGTALRASRHAEAHPAPPAPTPVASARAASHPGTPPQTVTQPADDGAPKPAGELFVPFVADNPSQVFAPSTVQYHAALQGEAQDPAWGPAAEAALRAHFAQFGERFEIPYVDCRQNLCELQVASRVGGDLQQDMRDVQDAMARMQREAWWSALEFDQQSGTVASSPDGRALALWFFSRK